MSDEGHEQSADDVWCVVANVKREHAYGQEGAETNSGTRQFRGGTKVYIAGCYAGTCDGVVCIGLHRKSRRFITCVVKVTHLENFRPKIAYHPKVVELVRSDKRCWFKTQEDAEGYAASFPAWQQLWRPKDGAGTNEKRDTHERPPSDGDIPP